MLNKLPHRHLRRFAVLGFTLLFLVAAFGVAVRFINFASNDKDLPKEVFIEAGKTVRLNIDINTGIR